MFNKIGVIDESGAKCVRCNKRVEAGEVAMWSPGYSEWGSVFAYHLRCAIDEDPNEAAALLGSYKKKLADKAALIELAQARLAERDAERARREKPPLDVSMLPRARVYLAGSAMTAFGTMDDLSSLSAELRWPSPLRNYQFVVVRTGEALPADDPEAPYVAAVFAVFSDARVVANQKQKLADWRALGLPTPVLWVFSRGASVTPTDAEITKLREVLDGAGFVGDEARVACARKVDRAALDALVAAIDESTGLARGPRIS